MPEREAPVGGRRQVGLNRVGPELESTAKRCHGVLDFELRGAAMADHQARPARVPGRNSRPPDPSQGRGGAMPEIPAAEAAHRGAGGAAGDGRDSGSRPAKLETLHRVEPGPVLLEAADFDLESVRSGPQAQVMERADPASLEKIIGVPPAGAFPQGCAGSAPSSRDEEASCRRARSARSCGRGPKPWRASSPTE